MTMESREHTPGGPVYRSLPRRAVSLSSPSSPPPTCSPPYKGGAQVDTLKPTTLKALYFQQVETPSGFNTREVNLTCSTCASSAPKHQHTPGYTTQTQSTRCVQPAPPPPFTSVLAMARNSERTCEHVSLGGWNIVRCVERDAIATVM